MPNLANLPHSNRWAPSKNRQRAAIAALCASAAFGTASCATADSSGSAQSNTVSEATSNCGKEATAAYQKVMASPKFVVPPAFDASSMAGKKFAYVGIINNSVIQDTYAGFKEALESVGAKPIYFDGKGRPDVIAQSIQSAIAQGVSAIITDGFDGAALAKSAVTDAGSANIPVVNSRAGDPSTDVPDGIVANVAPDIFGTGTAQADYALAKTDCKLHALAVYTSVSQLNVDAKDALKEEVERLCPDDCNVTEVDVNAATYQTELTPQIQTALQRDPSINVIVSNGGDPYAPYIDSAVKAVNSKAFVVSAEGSALSDAIKGNSVVAEVLWSPADVAGYFNADAVMRAANGEPMSVTTPIRLVDATNWGVDPDRHAQFPEAETAKDGFKAAWGLN